MTKFGSAFSATDGLKRAPGESHNASLRVSRNHFNLVTEGGTAEGLQAAILPVGAVLESWKLDSDQNLAALGFKLGTLADDDKYGTQAGPNATVVTKAPPLANALAATTEQEVLVLTPSGALPGAGALRVTVFYSQR